MSDVGGFVGRDVFYRATALPKTWRTGPTSPWVAGAAGGATFAAVPSRRLIFAARESPRVCGRPDQVSVEAAFRATATCRRPQRAGSWHTRSI
jgi:hypothetical protein